MGNFADQLWGTSLIGVRSYGRQEEQAPRPDSAASEDAEVLRCHERCGCGRAPTRWPGGAGAFGASLAVAAAESQVASEAVVLCAQQYSRAPSRRR